jgi:hypothetical protein
VDWSATWNGIFGSEWRRLCRGCDVEGSQQPEVQVRVDGSTGAPLQVSLNAAVSASSGACPAQPTVRELPVPVLVAPLGGMRGFSGRSASGALADRAGIG